MCLLFATREDLDIPSRDLLSQAYERACDELQGVYSYRPEQLGEAVDTMVTALMDLFHAGQRDEQRLSRYAVSRVLSVFRTNGVVEPKA